MFQLVLVQFPSGTKSNQALSFYCQPLKDLRSTRKIPNLALGHSEIRTLPETGGYSSNFVLVVVPPPSSQTAYPDDHKPPKLPYALDLTIPENWETHPDQTAVLKY